MLKTPWFMTRPGDTRVYNRATMKAHVYVTLKRTVLDPQGQTIHGALKRMQYTGVEDVRQGKYFQLTLRAMDDRRCAGRSGTHRPRGADQPGDRRVYLPPGRISNTRLTLPTVQ